MSDKDKTKILAFIVLVFTFVGLVRAQQAVEQQTLKEQLVESCNLKVAGFETALIILNGNVSVAKVRLIYKNYIHILGVGRASTTKAGKVKALCNPDVYIVKKVYIRAEDKRFDPQNNLFEIDRDV